MRVTRHNLVTRTFTWLVGVECKQTAVHIPHEANVEQVFSTAGLLSNVLLDPGFLADLVMISRNKKVYKPEVKKLLSKYFQKYSKAGKLPFEEETLGLAEEEEE